MKKRGVLGFVIMLVLVSLIFLSGCSDEQPEPTTTTTTQKQIIIETYENFENDVIFFRYPADFPVDVSEFNRTGFVKISKDNIYFTVQVIPTERYANILELRDKLAVQVKVLRDVEITKGDDWFEDEFMFKEHKFKQYYSLKEEDEYYLVFSITSPDSEYNENYKHFEIIRNSFEAKKKINFEFIVLPLEQPETVNLPNKEKKMEEIFLDFQRHYYQGNQLIVRANKYFTVFKLGNGRVLLDVVGKETTAEEAAARIMNDVPANYDVTFMGMATK